MAGLTASLEADVKESLRKLPSRWVQFVTLYLVSKYLRSRLGVSTNLTVWGLRPRSLYLSRVKPIRTSFNSTSENAKVGIDGIAARGRRLWCSVYDPHSEKLLAKLGSYHPDFPGTQLPLSVLNPAYVQTHCPYCFGSRLVPPISGVVDSRGHPADFIIHQEYGALLSDPPHDSWPKEGRVGRALTSVTGVACLRASGGVGPQMTSHVYGLLKAPSYEEDAAAAGIGEGEEWLSSPEGATWVIGVVDKLVDVLNEKHTAPVRSNL